MSYQRHWCCLCLGATMAEVVYLADKKSIPPKSATFEHAGQKYTCIFDPNAPKGEQWVWKVDYVRTYRYFGSSPTMEMATVKARRKIHEMNVRMRRQEEDE